MHGEVVMRTKCLSGNSQLLKVQLVKTIKICCSLWIHKFSLIKELVTTYKKCNPFASNLISIMKVRKSSQMKIQWRAISWDILCMLSLSLSPHPKYFSQKISFNQGISWKFYQKCHFLIMTLVI